jgi:hypothetical protein
MQAQPPAGVHERARHPAGLETKDPLAGGERIVDGGSVGHGRSPYNRAQRAATGNGAAGGVSQREIEAISAGGAWARTSRVRPRGRRVPTVGRSVQ